MDWIFDNFQILALVGIAFASWLKSRADAKAAEREEQQAREEMSQPEPSFGPADYRREMQIPPPPPPIRRPAIEPSTLQQALDQAALDADKVLKRQMEIQERLREIRETKAVTTGGATVTRERQSFRKGIKSNEGPVIATANLRSKLRQREEVRRAVLMREILGPPLGLR